MEDLRKGNRCYKCFSYKACYLKGANKLVKTRYGYCVRQSKIVENGDCCTSFWKRKPKIRNKAVIRMHLCGMMSDLRDLRLLLEEEERDRENEDL